MKYVTEIKNCEECHHQDHSGAFTPGGAQPVCGHPDTVERKGTSWKKRVLPHIREIDEDQPLPGYRIMRIPAWCPLRATEVKG